MSCNDLYVMFTEIRSKKYERDALSMTRHCLSKLPVELKPNNTIRTVANGKYSTT